MIKKIYCFGSSHTEGGGFHDSLLVTNLYKNIIDTPTMSKLSWPGILQNILGESVDVHNYGKSGSGNERIYRMVLDLIFGENQFQDTKFNKEETLILIEPTNLDRKEYYSTTIQDHVVVNYRAVEPKSTKSFHVVQNHYFEDEPGLNNKLNKKLYYDFLIETSHFDVQLNLMQKNLLMFFSFLELHNINFKIVNSCNIFTNSQEKYKVFDTIKYSFQDTHGEYNTFEDFTDYASKNGKLIQNETHGRIDDPHQGYFVNRVISQTINNILIGEKMIDGTIVEIQNSNDDFNKIQNVVRNTLPII